jgi:hypothetical protein
MAEVQHFDPGKAGASSRREYERRRAKREEETRKRHPYIGNFLLKVREAPADERAWLTGAVGEEALAASLARRCPQAIVLHDRRMPRSRANIDHLAVVPSGVYVIDAKRYRGKIEIRRPFFGEAELRIAGRNKTKLVEGLERQVEVVQSALRSIAPRVPVNGCFCFINPDGQRGGTDLPLLRTLRIKDYPLLYPRKLTKLLQQAGELGPDQVQLIAEVLAERFPCAVQSAVSPARLAPSALPDGH